MLTLKGASLMKASQFCSVPRETGQRTQHDLHQPFPMIVKTIKVYILQGWWASLLRMQRVKNKFPWLVEGTFLSWEAQEVESTWDAPASVILCLFQTTSLMPITKVCDKYENICGVHSLCPLSLWWETMWMGFVDGMFFSNSPRLLVPIPVFFILHDKMSISGAGRVASSKLYISFLKKKNKTTLK